MDTGGIAQLNVVITNTSTTDVFENVFHFQAQIDGVSLDDLATDFEAVALTPWISGMGFAARCALLQARDVVPGTEAGADHAVSPAVQGGNGSQLLPLQDAGIITWRTALAGRSHRGRSYFPLMVEDQTDGAGILNALGLSSLDDAASAVFDAFGDGGTNTSWRLGVVSRQLNGAPVVPPTIEIITAYLVRPVMGTQRRRRTGVGS